MPHEREIAGNPWFLVVFGHCALSNCGYEMTQIGPGKFAVLSARAPEPRKGTESVAHLPAAGRQQAVESALLWHDVQAPLASGIFWAPYCLLPVSESCFYESLEPVEA